ncbi:hypothetical protein ABK040_001571 [Willaertia magna]
MPQKKIKDLFNKSNDILDHMEEIIEEDEDEINDISLDEIYKKKKKTYYEILGVSKQATQREIVEAFRKQSRKCHPDAQRLSNEQKKMFKQKELEEYFEEKQKQLNEAYEVLSNEKKRAQYDVLGKHITSLVPVIKDSDLSFEELKNKIREYKKEQLKTQRSLKTNSSTSASLEFDVTGLFNENEEEEYTQDEEGNTYLIVYPKFVFSHSSISHSFQTPITPLDTFLFHGHAGFDHLEKSNISHSVALQWRHIMNPTKESTSIDLTGAYSSSNPTSITFILGANTKLSDVSFGGIKWISQLNGVQMNFSVLNWLAIAGFQVYYKRQLFNDKNLFGTLNWSFPQDNGVTLTIEKDLNDNSSISSDFKVGLNQSHISCEYRKELSSLFASSASASLDDEEEVDEDNSIELVTDVTLSTTDFSTNADISCNTLLMKSVGEETELGFGVGFGYNEGINFKLSLKRERHTFNVPILLTHSFNWKVLLFSIITPITLYSLFKSLIYSPIQSYYKKKELKNKRKENYERTREKREKALIELEKMKVRVNQIREAEEQINGLIVISARYGDLAQKENGDELDKYPSWVDLTDQLQYHVVNSKLSLPDYSKSRLEGSFDPAPYCENKTLLIWYSFRGKKHQIEIGDEDELSIPLLEEDLVNEKE